MFNNKKSKKQGIFGGSNNKKKSKKNDNGSTALIAGLVGAAGTMVFNMATGAVTDYGRDKIRGGIETFMDKRNANKEVAASIEENENEE